MSDKRILIVEDEFIIAQNLRQILVDLGYEVAGHAFDADEALALLRQGQTDLVLIDIKLGAGIDGIELAAVIRKEFALPFIFLTSHSDKSTIGRAKDVHPSGYLVKPFNKAEIFPAIEIALANLEADTRRDHLFIKVGPSLKKVYYQEITLLKADRVYVEVHRKGASPLIVRESLNAWEEKLPPDFLRVHRSYIVHLPHVQSIDTASVTVDGKVIAITRQVREELLERLGR
jgi:DNA-binding LytR/AlgR family response regulator